MLRHVCELQLLNRFHILQWLLHTTASHCTISHEPVPAKLSVAGQLCGFLPLQAAGSGTASATAKVSGAGDTQALGQKRDVCNRADQDIPSRASSAAAPAAAPAPADSSASMLCTPLVAEPAAAHDGHAWVLWGSAAPRVENGAPRVPKGQERATIMLRFRCLVYTRADADTPPTFPHAMACQHGEQQVCHAALVCGSS
jgi:hypothetical protein